ncbi:MAG: tetratricopeptide repeat protein, partial [Planctomycetota bacterium]|nr:tetratricopeptide repeat protein [Planctomycetota bacterium]
KQDATNLIIGDGRNHVFLTRRIYDVITSEPSNPWIAGIGNLFTLEFWRKCSDRLSDDGIMCQWLQTYQVNVQTFQFIVRTFKHVFPNMTLWYVDGQDLLLIGSKQPVKIDYKRLQERMSERAISEDLRMIGVHDAPMFLAHFAAAPDDIDKLAGEGPLHTDDNARLEFDMPRQIYTSYLEIFEKLEGHLSDPVSILQSDSLEAHERSRLAKIQSCEWHIQWADLLATNRKTDAATRVYLEARSIISNYPRALLKLFLHHYGEARDAYDSRDSAKAEKHLKQLLPIHPRIAKLQESHPQFLEQYLEDESGLNELYAQAASNLGVVLLGKLRKGNSPAVLQDAIETFRFALKLDPESSQANTNLGSLLIQAKQYEEALKCIRTAIRQNPESPALKTNEATALESLKELDEARASLKAAILMDATFWPAHLKLGMLQEKQNET